MSFQNLPTNQIPFQNIPTNQIHKFSQGQTPTNTAGINMVDFKQMTKSPMIKQEMMVQNVASPYPEEKKKSKLNIVRRLEFL